MDMHKCARLLPGLYSALLILLLSNPVFSQQTKVSGKIVDAENGSPIVGASVVIQESKKGASSDVEGRFFLQIDKSAKYTLKVTALGYTPKVVDDITPGNNTVDISLEKDKGNQLELVVVKSSSAKKESVASIYLAQKNSSSISDGISAEMIKRSPDKSTGEVLKRVSGASIQDNRFVVIRGLNERYNASLLNNAVLPSTEPDKKAFSFDIIPSSLVDNVVIYKTATPDLPGDFSGGAVKISTKDYPARAINELSVSVSYNTLTTFKDFYKSYPNGSLDFLGFFDKSRTMPGSYYRHRGSSFISQPADFKKAVTKQFPNTFGYEAAAQSLPNISVSYTGGNTRLLNNNKKFGYIYSVGYSTGHRVSERERSDYFIDKQFVYRYNTNNYDVRNNLSALLNLTYSYGRSKISLKNLFNNEFVKTTGIRNGLDNSNQPDVFYYKSANSEATANGIFNSVLEGLHSLKNDWTVDWNGSFGLTYRWQPDQRILTLRSPFNENDNYYLRLSNENSPEIRNAGRVYSFLKEKIYGANVNVTKQFRWWNQVQKLKLGTANYYRDRSVEVEALGYASLNFSGATINENKGSRNSFQEIFSPQNIDTYNLTVANIGTNSTDYTGTGLLNAGYAMMDNKFSSRLKLTWGARVENYRQQLKAKGQATLTKTNFDVLPSALLTYALTDKTNLRLAGSQAVNRPEFRELANYSVYDYDNYFVVRGNPALERCKNTNADFRYEWFPAAGEIVSVSVFYKYFDKPIEQTNQGNDVLTFQNADNANTYGAEIEVRKRLGFIGGSFFRHLTFYTNAAYIDGSVKFGGQTFNSPLQGQSPYLINSGLTYSTEDEGFSCNLLYNRIGPRLRFRAVGGGALNIFERPRDVIDFQVTKKILSNKLELKLTLSDLLAQAYTWYYKYDPNPSNTGYKASEDKIINSIKYGTTGTLSLRYNFGR
jgi:TonB-dependent receptor